MWHTKAPSQRSDYNGARQTSVCVKCRMAARGGKLKKMTKKNGCLTRVLWTSGQGWEVHRSVQHNHTVMARECVPAKLLPPPPCTTTAAVQKNAQASGHEGRGKKTSTAPHTHRSHELTPVARL